MGTLLWSCSALFCWESATAIGGHAWSAAAFRWVVPRPKVFFNRRWYCTEMSSVMLFISRCFNLVADQSIQILLLMIVGEVNLCELKI